MRVKKYRDWYPVAPGEAVLVRPLHDPLTLLSAPVIWPTRVRKTDPKLGQELAATNLLELLTRASKFCRPKHIVGEVPLPPDVLLRAVEEEGKVVVPGHHRLGSELITSGDLVQAGSKSHIS